MTNKHVVKDTMHYIFSKWVQKDTERSWQKLIECLRMYDLDVLAKDIEDALKQHTQQQPLAGLLKLRYVQQISSISCEHA